MRIRARTVLVVAATMLALTAGATVAASFVVQKSYTRLERDDTLKSTRLVMSWMNQRYTALDSVAMGYATSDALCHFVRYRNRSYVDSNLTPTVLGKNGLDFIAILDQSGQPVYIASDMYNSDGHTTPPAGLLKAFASRPSWLQFDFFGQRALGLMLLPDGPAIVSARPILPTSTYGVVRGTLVAGKFLSSDLDGEALYLSTGLRATWMTSQSGQFAATLRQMRSAKGTPSDLAVVPLSTSTVAGYDLLPDVTGHPALIVQLKLARTIAAQGRRLLAYLIVVLGVFVVVSIIALVFHLDRSLLRRLSRLSQALEEITSSGETATLVPVEGGDEIGQLEGNINRMLGALEHSREALKEAAVKDTLTGLANRRRFEEELERELLESGRTDRSGAILWFDLDNFKEVNDVLGHSAGDELLVQFAALLREQMRKYSLVARWDGDEFAVIVPGADESDGQSAAGRILELLATRTFVVAGRELRLSTSAGVAVYPRDGQTMGPLLAHADAALYSVKATRSGHSRQHDGECHALLASDDAPTAAVPLRQLSTP